MRHLISLKEQTRDDILQLLDAAVRLKARGALGIGFGPLSHKTLIMLFQKTSTRTRLSFESAMTELGGHAIFLDARVTQLGLADFRDEIQAIMRFGDMLMFRALRAADVATAASFNRIPVIDACSEKYHPCQALSDILTMYESKGNLANIKNVPWPSIDNNVSNTLMRACVTLGIQFAIATPEVDKESLDEELRAHADATGLVMRTHDVIEAVRDADFVHTDTWMNMEFFDNGHVKPEYEQEFKRRLTVFTPYQLNGVLIDAYAPHARIMHCMPCHVGYEISRDAIDHPHSLIFDQAENRKHMQKAILCWLLEKKI